MNSNIYEMEGSQALFNNPYELASSDPMDNYHFEGLEQQLPAYPFGSQLGLDVSPRWPQGPEFRPPYQEGMVTDYALDQHCFFRSEVLDDCAKARFYARALEFYLLDNEHQNAGLSCPMAACTAQFKTSRDMLRHLKHCKKLADGKFWCPTCHRFESFRVRTGKRCSWDKDHFGRRLLQKSKNVFRGFGSNHSAIQQTPTRTRCPMCSTQLPNRMPGSGDVPFNQVNKIQSTKPATPPSQPELALPESQRYELFSTIPLELFSPVIPLELSGESSCENSPLPTWPGPGLGCTDTFSSSVVSSVSTSSNGNSINAGVSPTSLTHEEVHPTTRRHRSASILNKANHRVVGLCGDADTGGRIFNQRCASQYSNTPTSHSLQPLTPGINIQDSENCVGSSTLPATLTQQMGSRIMPKLRIATAQDSLDLAPPSPDIDMLLQENQTFDTSITTRNLRVTSLPAGTVDTPPNELSLFNAFTSSDDRFVVHPKSPIVPSPPISATSTPTSHSSPTDNLSKQEITCEICGWKPKRPKKSYLNKHMKRHRVRSPIRCTRHDCEITFTRRDNLTAHLRHFHSIPCKRRRGSSDSLLSTPQPKKKDLCPEKGNSRDNSASY
ncbi:hypothetical protein F5Y12DRAFT_432535 [Xylaria sp. FL1777]|nr:hypothetical protein F5Y12DRAFT_432535 [Xylaria sp. FL1777]